MQMKYRRLSQLAAIGATVLVGLSLSGCSMISGIADPDSDKVRDNDTEEIQENNTDTDSNDDFEGGQQSAFDMSIGDCWNDPEDTSQISDIEVVPCSEPHDNEVFALWDMSDGEYPGKDEVESASLAGCQGYFESYIGSDYATSSLEIFPLYPTSGSWENMDDREVVCSAYDMSLAKLTSSVQNSGL